MCRAADPLRCRVNNDIRPVLERLNQVSSSSERIINNERNIVFVSDLGDCFEIGNVQPRVADRFDVDGFCFIVDQFSKIFRLIPSTNFTLMPSRGNVTLN